MIKALKLKITNILEDDKYKEILKGASWAFILKVVALIFGYISTIIIARYYGPRTVGLYNLSFSIFNIITMIALLGFPKSILRFVGEYNNDAALKDVLKKMMFLSLTVSLLLIIIFYLFADYISVKFFHDRKLKKFIQIMLIGVPFYIISTLLIEFIRGLRIVKVSESLRNSISFFRLILILILIFIVGYNGLTPAISSAGSYIILIFLTFFYSVNIIKKLNFAKVSNVNYLKVLKISLPMFITSSIFMIMSLIDKIMLGFFTNPYDVGIYSVALKLATITSMVLVAINTIIAPKFSELYWAKDIENLKKVIRFSAKIIFFSSAPILLIYLVFPRYILSFFGKNFTNGYSALMLLSAGQFINSISGSVGNFLNMTDNQKIFRNIMFISLVTNIILNYLLIPTYSYNGAAFATAFSMVMWNIISLFYIKVKIGIYMGYIPSFNLKLRLK